MGAAGHCFSLQLVCGYFSGRVHESNVAGVCELLSGAFPIWRPTSVLSSAGKASTGSLELFNICKE
jgi:hypothetical protein